MNEEIPYTISLILSIIQYFQFIDNYLDHCIDYFLFSSIDSNIFNFKN